MTRHQRRKAARARKNAKAELLNSRALALLQSEKLKRNLVTGKAKGSRSLRSRAPRYLEGYSAHGSNGNKLGEAEGKATGKAKGNVSFDWSQVRDEYSRAGERISSRYAKECYAGCVPNCERADFKGPFKLKEKVDTE